MFNTVGTRPTFGMQQNTFGFGTSTSTASPFGQTQNFMGSAPNTGFNQNVGGFGSTAPMFGSMPNPQSSAQLFGNTNTSTFGTGQSGFGTSLFGSNQQQQQQQQPSTSGIFGNTAPTFGQQPKTAGFGFGQTQQATGLFGQAQPTQNTSLFQPSTSSNVFGAPTAFGTTTQSGTVFKFVPVTGTDSMQKSGIAQTISTKHHCITCMKEYEGKSLEELRWEDYQANRRGPQQSGFTTQAPFGAVASTTPSLFGQAEKPGFGQTTTFGQTPAFGTQANTNQNMFGRTSFGATTTTSTPFGFGTNTSTNTLFAGNQQNKFGQAPVFAQQQPTSTAFGTSTNIFAQNTAQNKSLFSTPNQPSVFGQQQQQQQQPQQQQSTFAFGQPSATQSASLFQTKTTGTGFFGNTTTSTPSFGQQQFSFGQFGTNTFNKQPQSTFGQPSSICTFGTNLNVQSGSNLFGNTQKQPSLFGNTNTTGSLFNNNAFQQQSSFAMPTQPVLQPPASDNGPLQSILQLTDPYGIQKCLEGLTPKKPGEIAYATNPHEIQKILESPKYSPPVLSTSTKKMKVFPPSNKKNLFDDVYEDADHTQYTFRNTPKRLVLNLKKSLTPDTTPVEHLVLHMDDADIQERSISNVNLNNESNTTNITSETLQDTGPNEKATETDIESTSGTYKYKNIEASVTSKDDIPEESSHLNIAPFDINKSLKELTKYDAFEVDESGPSTSDGRRKDSAAKAQSKEGEAVDSSSRKIDTCGIIFTRPDYYLIPPLSDLHTFVNSEGRCVVTGLVIGRIGYGNVFFSTPIDLTNMNLDELVHFRYRELTIYPDNNNKPPRGEGLNQPAQITLDCVWPKDRKKHTVVSDIDFLIALNFGETLRDVCLKHGTKFVDYRPDTGSWVFKVDHFSKYGFTDSDDEEASNRLEQFTAKQEEMRANEERRRQNADILEATRNLGLGGIQQPIETVRRAASTSTISTPQPTDVHMDFHVNMTKNVRRLQHTQAIKTLFEDESMSDMSSTDVKIMQDQLDVQTPKQLMLRPKDRRHRVATNVFRNLSGRVPTPYSLLNHRNYYDIAIFKGRSFKVGWGKGFLFTNIPQQSSIVSCQPVLNMCSDVVNYNEIGRVKITNRYVQLTKVNYLTNDLNSAFKEIIEEYLQIAFNNSKIVQDGYLPLYSSTNANEALNQYLELADDHIWVNQKSDSCAYVKNVWSLCASLWGAIDDNYTTRRELFSEWLERISYTDMYAVLREIPNEEVVKRIYVYMTCHRIFDAATLARKSHMSQITLLLTQLNANIFTKCLMNKQLDEWNQTGVTEKMDPDILRLYLLFAGHPVNRDVNICEDLKWQKALALHLWYLTTSSQSLNTAVTMYENSFRGHVGYSNYPKPPYACFGQIEHYDMQFHLMKLFAYRSNALEEILNTFTHTSDPTDYRLAWILLHSLSAFGIGRISENAKNHIHTSFAFQLENMGLYKWSIFVLMFIKDINVKMNLIRGVLERNLITDIDHTNIENQLVKNFKIPKEFLHQLKANKTIAVRNHWGTYKHLLYNKSWNNIHDVLSKEILPSLFLNEYYDIIESILTDLDLMSHKIMDWGHNGGVFLDFVKVRKALVVDKVVRTKEEAHKLYAFIYALCKRITFYNPKTSLEYVCCAELSKQSIAYFKTMQDILNFDFQKIYETYDYLADDFKIPPDYRVEDALETLNRFYFKAK